MWKPELQKEKKHVAILNKEYWQSTAEQERMFVEEAIQIAEDTATILCIERK